MRSSSNQKAVESGRKQSPGGGDGVSRRPAQKPWGSNTNAGQQKGSMVAQQNGHASQSRNTSAMRSTAAQKEGAITDKQAHERLMFLFGAAIGLDIAIITKTGEKFEGLLSGSSFSPASSKITLKMVKRLQPAPAGQVNGVATREAALVGSSPEHAMNFDLRDLADSSIAELAFPEAPKLSNGASSSFQTDTDISGNQTRGARELQRWVPESSDTTDFSLESNNAGTWDQFATNSQLFGAKSTYDENLYTTAIDRSAPSYKRREAEAERLAREIEGSTSTNAHMREERGQATEQDGEDEEEKYSGVRRDDKIYPPLMVGGANKYTPPARRAPTAQATVAGAPFDPAIISAQIARPEPTLATAQGSKDERQALAPADNTPSATELQNHEHSQNGMIPSQTSSADKPELSADQVATGDTDPADIDAQLAAKVASQGPTENVEVKVLHQFRQFADNERQRVIERRKAQQNQDRAAKLTELLRFSKSFKLKTPIPTDLIGILAKDPAKQEAIVEKAQKESSDSTIAIAPAVKPAPAQAPINTSTARKTDVPQPQASVPDRQAFTRGRGGYPQGGRSDRSVGQQPPLYQGRNNSGAFNTRFGGHQQERKGIQPPPVIPAPIPTFDGRIPPTGPMADQSGMTSPQRSNMHTPNSAISGKFNLNVKASEFRPTAATFNPIAPSQTPSSPGSTNRAGSISRTASPSVFFGNRKPKSASQRPSIAKDFNPVARMKGEHAPKKAAAGGKAEEGHKDYSNNGGIPFAFQTGPRWTVKPENDQKTYEEAFEQPAAPPVISPPSRSSSSQHVPYAGQPMAIPNGPASVPHISTPQHVSHGGPHQFQHQYEDAAHRMQYGAGTPSMFPSPSMASRQSNSTFQSPMSHPAQLSYQQQQYYGTPGQIPMQMQMRQYPGTPGLMHAQMGQMTAPMMVQQQSNGPYMNTPQHFNPQMGQMYSPNPSFAHPQQNGGYSSPGRMAPLMMQQGSQQGHPQAPNMMYSMSNQGAQMGYPQAQMGMHRGNYGGAQYGAPHQGYAMQHRTMSSGYGQIPHKMHPQMQQAHAVAMNGPPQGPAYGQMEAVQDEVK
ncbi:poly(A)-binding protein binding protein [Cladophialophora chaetospira]|uniref:Poly(A)-binding protein binding protein n=1 Tax=Cladophialophora chaetospira TaxID=386627 RepID=A0AA38X4R7_9EURO|nr:poly(A)-binding protein binding protein [Cladophialophora chaetospira]